jgi:hypothetical protein
MTKSKLLPANPKKLSTNQILLYQDENGITNINVKFIDEDVWITQKQLAEIYDVDRSVITKHINNIYKEGELNEKSTCANIALVQLEGTREVEREVEHYNLDVIIALGYRVHSQIATRFRIWATKRLHEYIQK